MVVVAEAVEKWKPLEKVGAVIKKRDMKVEVDATSELIELNRIKLSEPEFRKKVKKILSTVMSKARAAIARDAKSVLNEDPRKAYMAVRRTVYKRLLGGNVNILAKKKAGSTRVNVSRGGKLAENPHQRGGNRRTRSARTEQIDSYYGADRGFILRFVNAGTDTRQTRYGNRGRISARNWFGNSSQKNMEIQAKGFANMVDAEIRRVLAETGVK